MCFKTMIRLIVLVSVSAFLSSVIIAEDWPNWRGPTLDGISKSKKTASEWSKESGVLWRTPMPGQAGATPALEGDRIYTTSADGGDLVLICLQSTDGKVLWTKKVGSGNQDARAGEGNSASPSPCTDGKHVWVFFGTGMLACFDRDGNSIWEIDVNKEFGKLDIQFGMTSTPLLDGTSLYLQLIHGAMKMGDDTRTGQVICLDSATGKTKWVVDRKTEAIFECKQSYASPMLYRYDGIEFLIVHGADCTTGHRLNDGAELWRLSSLNGPSMYNAKRQDPTFRFVASPGVAPGLIVVPTCKEGPTIALRVDDKLKGKIDGSDSVIWTLKTTPDVSIPLIVDGLVYLLNKDGKLMCVEAESGKEVYLSRTHTAQHRASPIYADGKIYLCSNDGHSTVVKAGREFEIIASNDLQEPITASPIFSNGVLYIRTFDALYAIAP